MDTRHPDYLTRRNSHETRVVRDQHEFMTWYDKAAAMVFSGNTKNIVIDTLAPWGCDSTQSNGVVAGALQAAALTK